eukprot:GFUD01002151.1.p1 GENE.GFUD01002151.1~~GFUD01002151.1.p1  ORF type:complete len:420 (-),score=120.15 GFUD01002151.1:146-1405(-)
MTKVLVFKKNGDCEPQWKTQNEFLSSLKEHNLPARDLKLLLRSCDPGRVQHPTILPRPDSKCFIFLIEHVKMICFIDRCIILTPEDKVTQKFVEALKNHFNNLGSDDNEMNVDSIKMLQQINMKEQDFEHVMIEKAMENVVEKFKKHLQIMKPALELLLQQIEENAETNGLKKLLAVKKSLAQFQQNVDNVMKAVKSLLDDDKVMVKMKIRVEEKVDIEVILDSFAADIDEIDTEIKIFIDMIEDTDQFVSAHLDSVRNELMKMSLFIEIGGLIMGFGAVVGGIFGMNLKNDIEEDGHAFAIVIIVTLVLMVIMLAGFTKKYYQLKADTSSASTFNLLKNFFTYVDDLEYHLFSKNVSKLEFKDAVEKITKLKISDKESDYLFQMVDANNDGVIDAENELNLNIGKTEYTNHVKNGVLV